MASLVKELQAYFTADPHGKKLEIAEFKALTHKDRVELRDMLVAAGRDVDPLPEAKAA